MLTICALFYGDYPDLAARLLKSLDQAVTTISDFRFATNAANPDTVAMAKDFLLRHTDKTSANRPNVLQINKENRRKYPVMRDLLYGSGSIPPLQNQYVMWFDDDSYVKEPDAIAKALRRIQESDVSLLGEIWKWTYKPGQVDWIRSQPWCPTGAAIPAVASFVTGGWWIASMAALRSLDYPWTTLEHNGGDVMLSTALKLNRYKISNYKDGFAVNVEKRRGLSLTPVGQLGRRAT